MPLIAVGSYTHYRSHKMDVRGSGITVLRQDDSDGCIAVIDTDSSVRNPTFLSWDPARHFLYAVSEVEGGGGSIAVFSVDDDGIRYLASRESGAGPGCHLLVVPDEEVLAAVSYHDGRIAEFPLVDGIPGPVRNVYSYRGNGPQADRQASAHAHQVTFNSRSRLFYVCDLGSDRVWMHHPDQMNTPAQTALVTPPGYGPRHLAFDPVVPVVYILCELVPKILVAAVAPESGLMTIVQEVDSSPPGTKSAPAAVKIHPSRKTLAASNRFADTVAVFAVERGGEESGVPSRLNLVESFSCGGRIPRDIEFSADGSRLFIANQDSHSVTVRRFAKATGRPAGAWDQTISTGSPVCVLGLETPRDAL